MARLRGTADRACIVCGHNLGPYGRICDKCGSIQRPITGDGRPVPPDRLKLCERCGQPMPAEDPEDICEECAKTDAPSPIIWLDEEPDPHGRARRAAKIATGAALAAVLAVVIAMVFEGAILTLDILLVLSGILLGAAVVSWVMISRRPRHKVEYYAPIKPEKQQREPTNQGTLR